eukprot:5733771-Heterocapsa_arctica.AAC.1
MDKGRKRPRSKCQALVGQTSIANQEEVGPLYEPHGPGPTHWDNSQRGVQFAAVIGMPLQSTLRPTLIHS